MNDSTIRSQLREYYANISLDEQRLKTLVETTTASSTVASRVRVWKTRALIATATSAVLLFVIGLAVSTPDAQSPDAQIPDVPSPRTADKTPSAVSPTEPVVADQPGDATRKLSPQPKIAYRLVAFRSHSDACPHCRATGKTFQRVREQLDGLPIDVVSFNLGDADQKSANARQIDAYQLRPLIEGRRETAFLALTTVDGKLVREFKPSQGAGRIADRVKGLLR